MAYFFNTYTWRICYKSLFILSMSNMGTVGNISLVHNLELVLMSIIFFVFGIYFFLKKEK